MWTCTSTDACVWCSWCRSLELYVLSYIHSGRIVSCASISNDFIITNNNTNKSIADCVEKSRSVGPMRIRLVVSSFLLLGEFHFWLDSGFPSMDIDSLALHCALVTDNDDIFVFVVLQVLCVRGVIEWRLWRIFIIYKYCQIVNW